MIEFYGMHTKDSFARRFVAAKTLQETIPILLDLYQQGFKITLDILGERVTNREEAVCAADHYVYALDALAKKKLTPQLSIKLSQLGIDVDPALCEKNVERVLKRARRYQTFARLDMESSQYTARTLDTYYSLRRKGYNNFEVTTQAYLHRSKDDLTRHLKNKSRVRLCKGAYLEPASIAFSKKSDVNKNFFHLMLRLLRQGNHPAIATHDENLINAAKAYARAHNISHKNFEFEMLYGIRRDLADRLVKEGYTVRLYVPFGKEWYSYFVRRLLERPANAWFVVKNLFVEKFSMKRSEPGEVQTAR